MNLNGDGTGNPQPQKKTVAQIMRDKKKQTALIGKTRTIFIRFWF
jgi:phosphopentomutase